MKNNLKGVIILLITAIIWGSAFVAQSMGSNYVDPFTFNGLRFTIAGIVLLIASFFIKQINIKKNPDYKLINYGSKDKKSINLMIIMVGVSLFISATFQQLGIDMTKSASKSGFITTLYIVFVPIISILFGKKIKPINFLYILIALIGSYMVAVKEDFSLEIGDILTLVCAIFYAFQIIFVDKVNPYINSVLLCSIQTLIAGIISLIIAVFKETIILSNIINALPAILYAAILSSCIAYTMQIIGQKYTEPTLASMLMSLESVFALISGLIFLEEKISILGYIGSILIFISIILVQLDFKKIFSKKTLVN